MMTSTVAGMCDVSQADATPGEGSNSVINGDPDASKLPSREGAEGRQASGCHERHDYGSSAGSAERRDNPSKSGGKSVQVRSLLFDFPSVFSSAEAAGVGAVETAASPPCSVHFKLYWLARTASLQNALSSSLRSAHVPFRLSLPAVPPDCGSLSGARAP